MLSGRRYQTQSALGSAIHLCMKQIPRADYSDALRQWVLRLEKCKSVRDEYFEGFS